MSDENIKVILLDLNLPDMSGIELCRRIRKDRPNAIIVAISGYASSINIMECYQAGFDDYLEKPVGLKILLTTVHNAFEKRPSLMNSKQCDHLRRHTFAENEARLTTCCKLANNLGE